MADALTLEQGSVDFVDADLNGMNFRGYAAVFDSPWSDALTANVGYVETLSRGAFRKALSRSDNVPLLWQHDKNKLLATTHAGTLKLREDGKGLLVEASLPNTTLGNDVREHIARGEVRGMSYGRETLPEDSKMSRQGGKWTRTISNIRRLIDTTLTWEPAYLATNVELRAAGFACVPLQDLVEGAEAQFGDTVTDTTSRRRRARDLYIEELSREVFTF